jgi:hypothetical protein
LAIRRNPACPLGFRLSLVRIVCGHFSSSRGPNADQTRPPVGRSLAWGPCSVDFVARWAICDTGLPDLEDTDVAMLQLRDKLFDMDLKKLHGFELVTSKERMPAEREPAASTCRIGIMCDQNRVTVVSVDRDGIVVRSSEAYVHHAPALVAPLPKERTGRLNVDVLIQHEARLRNR